ncbi:O-glucosyltransferase rumi homolog isoform X1 [Neltuma alba]|uniref:O-glucosyltransferase rumi homolog isoform X1 n=2 Tax=Neltuma alba TaxID=207710 RepID=UPI0010A37A13|nr:O-glucosyltransferase rumi homolog isoform X1 [Prosopis alba]XP_028773398.1 O-glucosyltransferase rumi homolog isoform X1 [Prosopis alba]XP_028773399.1 O-glucosyltransferase rumi homolog isoform X1 [Prosopis alba]
MWNIQRTVRGGCGGARQRLQTQFQGYENMGSWAFRHFPDTIWRPFMKSPGGPASIILAFTIFLVVGALVCSRFLNPTIIFPGHKQGTTSYMTNSYSGRQVEIPLNCSEYSRTGKCQGNYPTSSDDHDRQGAGTCPEYFRWIHEDLRPWAHTGITEEMVKRAKRTANFKLVIVGGKAYVETYTKAFQTRDVFTLWGILQLLRRYPGKVPDLELMFDCVDWPVIRTVDYSGPNATEPPPLFRYCADDATLDIVFPDWSFWGWPEVNIKPWERLLGELKEGNKRTKWTKREPYAYWKGNPAVAETRQDLLKCNLSQAHDWNARLYSQDWISESRQGFKKSDLASQCTHRYKIYIEGSAWSVSEKYILSCDSVTFLVTPHYYDFFTRGLLPLHHYWPIKEDDKCRSIKFAVDWGNTHKKKAQEIGKAASDFVQEELKMEYVYDYMFHLLSSYAKLLRYKPRVSEKAVELCAEAMVCKAEGLEKKFMMDSMVKAPSNSNPCTLPPPYDPPSLHHHLRRKQGSLLQVESWQRKYWEKQGVQ